MLLKDVGIENKEELRALLRDRVIWKKLSDWDRAQPGLYTLFRASGAKFYLGQGGALSDLGGADFPYLYSELCARYSSRTLFN